MLPKARYIAKILFLSLTGLEARPYHQKPDFESLRFQSLFSYSELYLNTGVEVSATGVEVSAALTMTITRRTNGCK